MKKISVLIRNKEQLASLSSYKLDCIYTDNLKLAQEHKELYYQVPKEYHQLDPNLNNLLISDLGLLSTTKNIVTDYFLNISNNASIKYLKEQNVKKITLSIEVEPFELKELEDLSNCEVLIYGLIEVMNIKKHNLLDKDNYILKSNTNSYLVKHDEENLVKLFDLNCYNKLSLIDEYVKLGIKYFRLDFLNESPKEIKTILDKLF